MRSEIFQRLSRDVLHDHVRMVMFGYAEIVDGDDVEMIQATYDQRLALEACPGVLLLLAGPQHLDGYEFFKARVSRLENQRQPSFIQNF